MLSGHDGSNAFCIIIIWKLEQSENVHRLKFFVENKLQNILLVVQNCYQDE